MENMFWNGNLLLTVTVLLLVIHKIHCDCVADKTTELKTCFDKLKTSMDTEAPSDVNTFLCGDTQKERLECVIKHFNDCPAFVNESFIDDLKHTASGFHAKDLFHVDSADEFCKCSPTFSCLKKVETEKLGVELTEGPWKKIANQEYICGLGRINIDCVATSLPSCMDYLQYKHNKTVGENSEGRLDINSFQFASDYADRHCKTWPDDDIDHSCTMKRVGWNSVEVCYNQIDHLREVSDKICGMRTCIEKAMYTCPEGEMDYFIDAVNIFSETKISTDKCSSAVANVAPIFLTLLMFLLCILF